MNVLRCSAFEFSNVAGQPLEHVSELRVIARLNGDYGSMTMGLIDMCRELYKMSVADSADNKA